MKKLLFTLIAVSSASIAFGQNKISEAPIPKFNHQLILPENVNDTIGGTIAAGCNTGPFLTRANGGGWVAGTNGYEDQEKAQRITVNFPGNFYSILVAFGSKQILGAPDNVTAKIYAATATGVGALVATSSPVSTSNIDTAIGFTKFSFPTPVSFTPGNYFLSVVVGGNASGIQDTIGIIHTDDNCGNNTAWEKWSDGNWYAMNDSLAWGLDVSLYIFAEVEALNVSTSKNIMVRNSHKFFPNPATKTANLEYAISDATTVTLQIVDLAGRIVNTQNLGVRTSGIYTHNLDLSGFKAGVYFYTLSTDGETRNGKFVVE